MIAVDTVPRLDLMPPGPGDVMEISVLLPGWQMAALEAAARDRGLTAGQIVRRIIRDYVMYLDGAGRDDPEKLDAAAQW
jgi:hypothetical protein